MPKRIDSLYLHFPFCLHLCNYCDFYKKISQNKVLDYQNYHTYLAQSFDLHQNLMERNGYSWAALKTLYIGGGTPSLWGKEGKIFLENFFKEKKIELSSDCEFTLEVNPGAWNDEVLSEWQSFGANRFSLGIQSFDPQMIKYLDRKHSINDVYDTLEYFKKNNLNFSVDFMLGLPFSKELSRNVIDELKTAMSFGPSHFSVYILTVKDNYTHYKNLPDEEWIEKEFLQVADYLCSEGFEHYEVSNFSKPLKQSRHNLNYWKSLSVAALGPSATGFLKDERLRYKWKPNHPEMEFEYLTEEEFRLEKIYMGIRSEEGINTTDFSEEISAVVEGWKKRNLAYEAHGVVKLTSRGYLLLDSLMNDLFKLKLI
jgi:oxygen-independent coproporphyrinogen-3 oxidase